jgi:hypothetical protein
LSTRVFMQTCCYPRVYYLLIALDVLLCIVWINERKQASVPFSF